MSVERACMALADISGYTKYLNEAELDHAHDVIADLLGAVVNPLRPPFHVNKVEGDAVFLYTATEDVDASSLLDRVENAYFDFRRRILSINRATTCVCGACRLIPDLDLKLIIHFGEIIHQEILEMDELVGPDVIISHRLLKSNASAAVGTPAYALFTEAATDAIGIEPELMEMTPLEEDLEGVGPTSLWIHDLARAWKLENARRRFYVAPVDALWSAEALIPDVAPVVAWEWLTRPDRRAQWEVGFDEITEESPSGRRGVGTQTHCVHGESEILEEVLDWRPPKYATHSGKFAGGEPFVVTDEVVDTPEGVVVRKSIKAASQESREDVAAVLDAFKPALDQFMPNLVELILADPNATAEIPAIPELDIAHT